MTTKEVANLLRRRAKYHQRIAESSGFNSAVQKWHYAVRDGLRTLATELRKGVYK